MSDFASNVTIEQATHLLAALLPCPEAADLPLEQALRSVLAADLRALTDHPSADESAMDGVACRRGDTLEASPARPCTLALAGESRAGHPYSRELKAGQAVRISTGAAIPEGADAVVPVEALTFSPGSVQLRSPADDRDIRRLGADFRAGELLLRAGRWLGPAELALAAAMGHSRVAALRPFRVGLLTTGDEVVEPGKPLAPGQVYDSNRFGLSALIREQGCALVQLPHLGDDPEQLAGQLEHSPELDLLITSGGVSVGEHDLVRQLLFEQGEVSFWKVRIRPGGPLLVGRYRGLPICGLPGNPVSALVVFEVIVKEALRRATGRRDRPSIVWAQAGSAFPSLPDKTAFWRGQLEWGEGKPVVSAYRSQSSGVLRSLSESNALVEVPAGQGRTPGELVRTWCLA